MMILLSMLLGAVAYSDTYSDGVQAYDNQHYSQSIDHFETLVYNRIYEAEVFYNLGNAYFQAGNHPEAIANYERALRINPTLTVAYDNLQQVVKLTQQQLPRPQPDSWESQFYFWHTPLKTSTSLSLTILFWWLMCLGLTLRAIRPRKYLRRISWACGLLAFIFFGSWQLKAHPMELAVAQGDTLPVRIGTKETDTIRFELFSGDRVKIDAHKGEYVRVITVNGDRGWVDAAYLIPVWPPVRGTEK